MILSLSLINLLEQLIELTETFYLLDHWLIIKDYNSGTSKIAEMKRKGMRKMLGASMPSPISPQSPPVGPLSPNLHMFANPQCLLVFMEASQFGHS